MTVQLRWRSVVERRMLLQRGLNQRVMPVTAPPPKNHRKHGERLKSNRVVKVQKAEVQKPESRIAIYRGDLLNSGVYRTVPVDIFPDKPNWMFRGNSAVVGTPVITDKSVFFVTRNGILFSLDRSAGRELWRFASQSSIYGSPAIGSVLVLFNGGNRLFSLKATTGKPSPWNESWSGREVYSNPKIVGHRVYVGGFKTFFCLEPISGRPTWISYERPIVAESSPIVDRGTAYSVGYDAEIVAMEAGTGRRLWYTAKEESWTTCEPVLHQGRLYCQVMECMPWSGSD